MTAATRHALLATVIATTTAIALLAPGSAAAGAEDVWRQLEPGLELARFSTRDTVPDPRGDLVVLRVDPARWSLRVLRADATGEDRPRDTGSWCEEFGLVAAINAGMFQDDHLTHVGFLQCDGVAVNGAANAYLSATAFGPLRPGDPPFRIYDLDETPLERIAREYACVVQNLRLIKRPRESRWQRRDRRWTEAALGEDGVGRALLIHCRTALTMPDLIDLLLALPLDLRAAQHLEGGGQAQLHIAHPAARGYHSGAEDRWLAWPIPNVLGVARRDSVATRP